MSARSRGATAGRVLRQLRHDPRTIALMLVVPCALLALLRVGVRRHAGRLRQVSAPLLLGIFPLIAMFLVTSIATLRERTSGTLERLLTMPMGKPDFLLGYALAFGAVAGPGPARHGLSLRAARPRRHGPVWCVVARRVLVALLGTALGLFVSAFAAAEFQAVQFMPAVILPQLLLCGILGPRDQLPTVLRWVSDVLPLTYAVDAMQHLAIGDPSSPFPRDIAVIVGFTVGFCCSARRPCGDVPP